MSGSGLVRGGRRGEGEGEGEGEGMGEPALGVRLPGVEEGDFIEGRSDNGSPVRAGRGREGGGREGGGREGVCLSGVEVITGGGILGPDGMSGRGSLIGRSGLIGRTGCGNSGLAGGTTGWGRLSGIAAGRTGTMCSGGL